MPDVIQQLLASESVKAAIDIWVSGGWAMVFLAVNALLLFWVGSNVWLNMKVKGRTPMPDKRWKSWIKSPAKRKGQIGELMTFALSAGDVEELQVRFNEVRSAQIDPYARDLKFMRRAVSTAPLVGLLGTVTGMLTTFQALATGGGGDQTMDMIARGISEALVTTETGLMIALPGLMFQFHLTRQRDRYEAFLAKIETACAQHLYKLTRRGLAPQE